MKRYVVLALAVVLLAPAVVFGQTCTPTGYVRDGINLTARLINPSETVTGEVDATGCNIGVYYNDGVGLVKGAEIHGANYFGVVVDANVNDVRVDIMSSTIHDIGETPLNGSQHGVAIYYVAYGSGHASGRITGNTVSNYQKGGIVTNGAGTQALVMDNVVTGQGPVSYIAQNGIQIGYGATASVTRNTVAGNSYTGTSDVSGGIIVVGGPYYGNFYTIGTQIVGNIVLDNDIGIFLSNLAADGGPADVATNVKAVNNVVANGKLSNNYGGFGYQAGISDVGNNDKIINNRISGNGYNTAANPGAYTVPVDADASFTNRPKVHANK